MQIPLQITYRGLGHSDALDAQIRGHSEKLDHVHSRIMSCRIVVELDARHKHQGKEFEVHVQVKVPGDDIAARKRAEDVHVALREAFDAATRQLENLSVRHKDRNRHRVE